MSDAFNTDVRPLLMQVRSEIDLPLDPIATLRTDTYARRIAAERGEAVGCTSGHPGA